MLSNKGLRADGEVAYLSSTTMSKSFVFFPDSMNTKSESFDIPQIANGKYPPISGKGVYQHWMPYNDSMYVYKVKDPILVYNGKIDFSGSFILTPAELVGNGNMAYQNLNLSSTAFAFLPKNIKTQSGNVNIKSEGGGGKAALTAENVTADLDLTKDFGRFQNNVDTSKVFLPSNKFATTLNNFTYDITKKEVNFTKAANQAEEDAYFISNNPEQDALQFKSKKASYNLTNQNIKAQGVPFLVIADSKIFTPNKEIQIEKEGNLGSIAGAEIVTDEESENHKIYNATVNIFSQKKFTGFGDYDYVDITKKKYRITFSDIRVNEQGNTVAKGTIMDTSNFFLGPNVRYSGSVNLLSTRKELAFDGYMLADNKVKGLRTEAVKVSEIIDPAKVFFTIDAPLGKDGKELYTGTFISSDSSKIYNLLFGKKKNPTDVAIFTTTGTFLYDPTDEEFVYGPRVKAMPDPGDGSDMKEGNIFRFSPSKNSVYTEGNYNLGFQNKTVSMAAAGNYNYLYSNNSNVFDLVMLVDFPMADDPAKIMTDSLLDHGTALEDLQLNRPEVYEPVFTLVKNKKDKQKALDEITANGVIPQNDDLNKTFVFTDLKMRYVDSLAAFVSTGKFGLANAKKVIINKTIGGVIELSKDKEGNHLSLLIEPVEGSYHYFGIVNDNVNYLSSDLIFVDKTTETANKLEKSNKGLRLKLATVKEASRLKMEETEQ
jgi:hypothetical protein